MESRRAILHHLGVVWRGRAKELDREQLPERWVDLIHHLNEQETKPASNGDRRSNGTKREH
jgi:hypothetical protein